MATLKLPFSDRVYSVKGNSQDLSVMGALAATDGAWEPHVMMLMGHRIRSGDVCIDIGANIGLLTLVMSDLASNGHVYAFEPSSQNAGFLRENLASNHISNVSVFETALWDRRGNLEMFHIDELAGCSFIDTGSDRGGLRKINSVITQPWMNEIELHNRYETVECLPLDDFALDLDIPRLDMIKLDAEGAEVPVISGATKTIHRYRPQMITEFNPACMAQYFGRDARGYFELLRSLFPAIFLIEAGGSLTGVPSYDWLLERVATGKGWEDLFCCFE